MGLLSWLFPSEEDKLARAEALLERGEYVRARDAVNTLTGERADAVRAGARDGLKRMNIQVAVGYARAGEEARAQEHLELAQSFADPGDPEMKGARRALREARQEAREARKPKATLGAPGGAFGGALTGGLPGVAGGVLSEELPPDADPLYALPPSDPRLRFAMLLENYPDDIRQRMAELGPEYATAVVAIDDGAAEHAIDILGGFVEQDPVARFERARGAMFLGRLGLAASDLEAFAATFGHQRVGVHHTAVMLAQALAGQRRLDDALAVVERALADAPEDVELGALKASLLEGQGKLAEADELARALVSRNSRQMGLYKLMARCRLKAGKRVEAAQALEAGLTHNCTSGKCGSLPFDVDAGRMLARIYLEDRVEPRRASELVARIKRSLQEPTWFEAYLDALVARNHNDPETTGMVRGLAAGLSDGDPRRTLLGEAFPGSA
ncbi:MAG: hypothetical protein H6739_10760 [Alphaproteobacteria bacterium]|nr:hypothetical protein [Alphaproteobacteria bacterium]